MTNSVAKFPGLAGAKYLRRASETSAHSKAEWNRADLSGRLVELCGKDASAVLTAAFGLVLDAQQEGETVAWITPSGSLFFPPDAAEGGVDLDALAVIRVPDPTDVPKAADKLARSGALGLIVLDLQEPGSKQRGPSVPMPLQSRLMGLAQKHDTAIVFLSYKTEAASSLSSLISLRGRALRTRVGKNEFQIEMRITKDKHRAPNWRHTEMCRGPAGMR
ncbi:MAG: recombinase A [Deltaproteobacteria bacterium]|nr:recombinase A [Deltaproteobacteria bacterium]